MTFEIFLIGHFVYKFPAVNFKLPQFPKIMGQSGKLKSPADLSSVIITFYELQSSNLYLRSLCCFDKTTDLIKAIVHFF
jgi:hypothetical protein